MNGNFNNNYYGNSGYVPQNTNMQQAMYPQQTASAAGSVSAAGGMYTTGCTDEAEN